MAMVKTQTMFMTMPAFIMSTVLSVLWPKTMALGAVATGKAKAYEQTIPVGKMF